MALNSALNHHSASLCRLVVNCEVHFKRSISHSLLYLYIMTDFSSEHPKSQQRCYYDIRLKLIKVVLRLFLYTNEADRIVCIYLLLLLGV